MVLQQFSLFSGHEVPPSELPVYKISGGALIEQTPDTSYIYGFWDHLFGCWRVDNATGRTTEVVPNFPGLKLGEPWPRAENISLTLRPLTNHSFSPNWRFKADAAFSGLLSTIPGSLVQLSSYFGFYQWAALDLIWLVPKLADFIDQGLSNDQEQYVFACLALAYRQKMPRLKRQCFAEGLLHRKRHEFLSDLLGRPCGKSLIKILGKLSDGPHPPSTYNNLFRLMENANSANALQHLGSISSACLKAMASLPDDALFPRTPMLLENEIADPETTANMIRGILSSLPEELMRRSLRSLSAVQNEDHLFTWFDKWEIQALCQEPMPSPPIPGDRRLIPLSTATDILTESSRMENCLDTMLEDVLSGEAYFYHWSGQEPATVMLERDSKYGWGLVEALGVDNTKISCASRQEIEDAVYQQLETEGPG